jgi:hypothetical protein
VEPPSLETNAIRMPSADDVGAWIRCPLRAFATGLSSVPSALIVQMLVEGPFSFAQLMRVPSGEAARFTG